MIMMKAGHFHGRNFFGYRIWPVTPQYNINYKPGLCIIISGNIFFNYPYLGMIR